MARLEYRLQKDPSELICYYDDISLEELLVRNDADWFIRGGLIYERLRTEKREDVHLIFVEQADDQSAGAEGSGSAENKGGLTVEIRQFEEGLNEFPLVRIQYCDSLLNVLLLLQTETISIDGQRWDKTSFELDEDRKMFVYYAKRSI